MLTLGFACSDDFLDVPPHGEMLPPDYFSKDENVPVELVNAIYNKMLGWGQHSFSWLGVSSITSDNADKGSDPGDTGNDKKQLDDWTFNADAISFEELWENNYGGIARANQALNIIPDMTVEENLKKRLEGESRFLRAYFYWNLVRMFGGVPKIDKVPDPSNEEDVINGRTRATAEEIYDLIISDLKVAYEALPVAYSSDADLGRATKGAAATFLAKVYLYQKNFSEVKRLTDEVMGFGYDLVDDYATIWREVGENSIESIFEVQARGITPFKGIEGYAVSQMVRNQLGWGFNTPSQSLADVYESGDVRREATIIFPGETMWDGLQIISNPPNPMYNEKAYFSKTHETFEGDWETNKNLRIFRFAEVLLMKAEAENELNNPEAALKALNRVRKRAKLGDIEEEGKDALRLIIWKERRVELAFEHDRTFDLRRQGRAGEVMRAHGKNYVDGKHDLFPIPQRQIELSGGLLTQNPMY
ncbi:RagB/SusD family nutrient uptake outer membrane protein [Marinilabiliaceae bacterium JC017]|nr:RagB/SusD family nutrient uptake outer membrane protein [Marinilabiliaceae bacterium JC017]